VTFDRIRHAGREPQNWLTFSGTLGGHRFSQLTQITPSNVAELELAWIWASQSTGRFEATPVVAEGVLYTVRAPNDVVALDALTGAILWTHAYTPAPEIRATGGGGRPNRGVAILGDRLFLGTLDAHLRAIDARTGKLVWDAVVASANDPACQPPNAAVRHPCYVITHAPLVVNNRVLVGVAGGDTGLAGYGIRGFIAAFDADTGKEAWRFFTIPAPGESGSETWPGESWKTGGAGVWTTGTYDPELNLTYWGVGNPTPVHDGKTRVGDNLYSNSLVALDVETGRLKWHYQFTPHDEMDWDSAHIPVLADVKWNGGMRKIVLLANKNGVLYVLDRTTGQFLAGRPFANQNWLEGFDEKGRPITLLRPVTERIPDTLGATNWHPPSFSPLSGLFYVPVRERPAEGAGNAYGAIRAFDPVTGAVRWEFKRSDATFASGVLTTASGVVFTGVAGDFFSDPAAGRRFDGHFYALDAATGELLWRTSLPSAVQSSPFTYMAGGTQFVAVNAAGFLFTFALRR
jgi:alcohol dehydrogenase (cytochrome c)